MLSDALQKKIESAVVRIEGKKGRGTLIHGEFVLTAAHCIDCEYDGTMFQGLGQHLETVVTQDGRSFRMAPCAVEPVSDIAVLGEADDQELPEDSQQFQTFRDSTEPVKISRMRFKTEEEYEVYMLDLQLNWIKGKLIRFGIFKHYSVIPINTEGEIEGGCSGGPIVNSDGQIIGVVANFSGDGYQGMIPIAHLALPYWVRKRILDKGPLWVN